MTELHTACKSGDLNKVKLLLSLGADANARDKENMTPLLWACRAGRLHVAKYLIEERNCSIEHKSKFDRTCLDYACWKGHISLVKYLIEERKIDLHGKNCLIYACCGGSLPVLRYLVEERHMDISGTDRQNRTCLMRACFNGRLPVVQYLIEQCHMNIEERNANGETGLLLACQNDHYSVVKYLILDCWTDSLFKLERSSFSTHMQHFLRTFSRGSLKEQRHQNHVDMLNLLSESGLRAKCSRMGNSAFRLNFPLRIMHQYELTERYSQSALPYVNLKVCFENSDKSFKSKEENNLVVVYVQKNRLRKSCTFMMNLLSDDFNDVQDGTEEDEMQSVQVSQELLQGCPSDWLKQLLIYLAWSQEGDQLYHRANSVVGRVLSFHDIVKVLKYIRACDALGLDVDVSAWTQLIQKKLEAFNQEWMVSAMKPREVNQEKKDQFCISDISHTNEEVFDLWTQVLEENDVLYFFLLVNSAPATVESPKTTATKCRDWLLCSEPCGSYGEALKNPFFVSALHAHLAFNFKTGKAYIPVDEEFVRKRRRIE